MTESSEVNPELSTWLQKGYGDERFGSEACLFLYLERKLCKKSLQKQQMRQFLFKCLAFGSHRI